MEDKTLIHDAFITDPQYQLAKKQILETIDFYKKQITKIKPPSSTLGQTYEDTLDFFNRKRGFPLFYPYIGSGFGNGALVELLDGSIKYDLISGIGMHWGHCHPKIVAAALNAAVEDIAMQGHLQQNYLAADLTAQLCRLSEFPHCLLCSSGAMANENALKLIFHKKNPAFRILAFEKCFAGRTLALASITDKPSYRAGLPATLHVDYVPFYDWKDPWGSTEKALQTLLKHLKRYPKQHACMFFELVQGEAGSYPGKREFFILLMKILKERGIAIIIDEVQTFGRGDRLFAFQHFDLKEFADIVTVGKLLHACAILYTSPFQPPPGLISQTVSASTASVHIALTILNDLLKDGYLGVDGKNMQLHHYFSTKLNKISEKHPNYFEGPFGYGLMMAATPFKGNKEKVLAFANALFHAGLITFVAGDEPTRLRFLLPAGALTFQDIDIVAEILENQLIKMIHG